MKVKLSLSVVLGMVLALPAFALQFVPLSIEHLSQKAHVVVHGTVREKVCLRDSAGRIYTKLTLEVNEGWKGVAGRRVFAVVQAGGTIGDRKVEVDGQEPLEVGEEVVLFLVLNDRQEGVVIGLSQGKFKVRHDEGDGQKYVHNLFHGKKPAPPIKLEELKRAVKGGAQ